MQSTSQPLLWALGWPALLAEDGFPFGPSTPLLLRVIKPCSIVFGHGKLQCFLQHVEISHLWFGFPAEDLCTLQKNEMHPWAGLFAALPSCKLPSFVISFPPRWNHNICLDIMMNRGNRHRPPSGHWFCWQYRRCGILTCVSILICIICIHCRTSDTTARVRTDLIYTWLFI